MNLQTKSVRGDRLCPPSIFYSLQQDYQLGITQLYNITQMDYDFLKCEMWYYLEEERYTSKINYNLFITLQRN